MQQGQPIRVLGDRLALTLGIAALMWLTPGLVAQVPTRVLTEEWRVGGPEGRGPTAFSSEPAVVVGPDGALYTYGSRDSHLTVFDSTGKFLRTIGRRGQGPGEFIQVTGAGFIGDTLWVSNWPNGAISTFILSGRHLATQRVIVSLRERFGSPVGISALLRGGRAIVIPEGALVGSDRRVQVPVLLGDRELQSVDTLLRVMRPEHLFVPGVGTFWYMPFAVPPRIDVASDGTGIVVVNWQRNAGEVEVRRLAPDGGARWSRTLTLPVPAIEGRVRDSIVDRAMRMAADQIEAAKRRGELPLGASTRSLVVQSLDLPDRYPPVTNVLLGIDGTVWLRRGGAGTSSRWLVLTDDGNPLFEVSLTSALAIREASRDAVWATLSDDDGYPFLVRYKVVAPS